LILYRLLTRLLSPAAWWGRLRVAGLEAVPERGAVMVVPNHDSQWDPVMVGLALRHRRPLRFLTRANLFRIRGLGPILRGAGQIPIERGAGDARALWAAVEALREGAAVCIFPEGTLSRGKYLRARNGVGRLAEACPSVRVVLCAVSGATDYVRFAKRPRVEVSFFDPAGGQPRPGEDPGELAARLLAEIRERVPPVAAGRRARLSTTATAPGEPETDAGR
jgi:1-acyl-sn-glycerol-3-phosphate acyltransferase